jgi:hypothetical protein
MTSLSESNFRGTFLVVVVTARIEGLHTEDYVSHSGVVTRMPDEVEAVHWFIRTKLTPDEMARVVSYRVIDVKKMTEIPFSAVKVFA